MQQQKFSPKTLEFLKKASRQKNPNWLDRNQEEYETVLREPLNHLARSLAQQLGKLAPDYHFPQKGLGRLRRPLSRVAEHGGGLYKGWMTYSAARPRTSRFEHNPNLYFMIDTEDHDDPVLVAGGLYMPSSKQMRALREAIANDASAFEELFASKEFKRHFPGGFSKDKSSSRVPRGFDPNHPKLDWIKLQAFFVWKPYTKKEFASPNFPAIVAKDWVQILRMNRLLEKAIQGRLPAAQKKARKAESLIRKLEEVEAPVRKMDF